MGDRKVTARGGLFDCLETKRYLERGWHMNNGEIGLIVLVISIIFGVIILANKKLRKNALYLLVIPAVGIIVGVVFFWMFATNNVVDSDTTSNESSQSSNCAPDELVCNE